MINRDAMKFVRVPNERSPHTNKIACPNCGQNLIICPCCGEPMVVPHVQQNPPWIHPQPPIYPQMPFNPLNPFIEPGWHIGDPQIGSPFPQPQIGSPSWKPRYTIT